eukprot:PhM_4_TR18786/c4_g1_i1/m.21511
MGCLTSKDTTAAVPGSNVNDIDGTILSNPETVTATRRGGDSNNSSILSTGSQQGNGRGFLSRTSSRGSSVPRGGSMSSHGSQRRRSADSDGFVTVGLTAIGGTDAQLTSSNSQQEVRREMRTLSRRPKLSPQHQAQLETNASRRAARATERLQDQSVIHHAQVRSSPVVSRISPGNSSATLGIASSSRSTLSRSDTSESWEPSPGHEPSLGATTPSQTGGAARNASFGSRAARNALSPLSPPLPPLTSPGNSSTTRPQYFHFQQQQRHNSANSLLNLFQQIESVEQEPPHRSTPASSPSQKLELESSGGSQALSTSNISGSQPPQRGSTTSPSSSATRRFASRSTPIVSPPPPMSLPAPLSRGTGSLILQSSTAAHVSNNTTTINSRNIISHTTTNATPNNSSINNSSTAGASFSMTIVGNAVTAPPLFATTSSSAVVDVSTAPARPPPRTGGRLSSSASSVASSNNNVTSTTAPSPSPFTATTTGAVRTSKHQTL